ncbi:helix-turn-helix transcriptional regulator [Pelagicoccus sp. SDUM812002]|uniref:AraC family transcriptional regulator n=1 Tax=Pelagicoccus sp. SDUM812002 TaxID=3041266 RepID=UPI0028105813|nr:helix-turn-helix transcriptional regulator [Pelagicoccus sp. SDUM812002]MDQ8184616.1 helix-turn-helix transcriptional regulator [Pelagicoccus sp. SDUM812002]
MENRVNQAHQLSHDRIDAASGVGFSFFDSSDRRNRFVWHRHAKHQLLVVTSGVSMLQTERCTYPLHKTRAALIPAGIKHETTVNVGCEFGSFFIAPELAPGSDEECYAIRVTPLLSTLVDEGRKWNELDCSGGEASRFFAYLSDVVRGLSCKMEGLVLPSPRDNTVKDLVSFAFERLETVVLPDVVETLGVRERTLRRKVQTDLGMSWRSFIRLARIVKASQILDTSSASISDVAFGVGFGSLSAFNNAFSDLTGHSPSRWRNRGGNP